MRATGLQVARTDEAFFAKSCAATQSTTKSNAGSYSGILHVVAKKTSGKDEAGGKTYSGVHVR